MIKTPQSGKTSLVMTGMAGIMVGLMIGAPLISGGAAATAAPAQAVASVAGSVTAVPGDIARFVRRVRDTIWCVLTSEAGQGPEIINPEGPDPNDDGSCRA